MAPDLRFSRSGREDSNLRPLDPQSSALTKLRHGPGLERRTYQTPPGRPSQPELPPSRATRRLGTFSPVRFGRRAEQGDDADVCIDLRERLAPYTDEDPVVDEAGPERELEPALTALPRRQRPSREPAYQPRHLAP